MDDTTEIMQLASRYNVACDYRDVDAYLACWTEDGFFESSDVGRSYQGHDQLREMLIGYPIDGRHVTTNFIIEVDGDSARQSAYLAYLDRAQGFAVIEFGVYDDELIREAGTWKYSSRRLKVDLP